jgi:phosphatidylethanolamine/phosphatidyl-N-methylethanolamine N-methyltransferase
VTGEEPRALPHTANRSWLREQRLIFGRFLRSPRTVGAIAPSSRALARRMVRGLESGPVRVVELGPGTGAFTGAIVERLGGTGRLVTIDIEPVFVSAIQQRWPSVECVCASAERLAAIAADRGLIPIDHIISGLPFASLPGSTTRQILDGIAETLRPGGTFTTFQYVHAYLLPTAIAFRRELSERLGSPAEVALVLRNVPPAFVLTWRRAGNSASR